MKKRNDKKSSKKIMAYFSSFIAICSGSVSPSSSTITGAHILLETSQQVNNISTVLEPFFNAQSTNTMFSSFR